jgi:hypothetical protein
MRRMKFLMFYLHKRCLHFGSVVLARKPLLFLLLYYHRCVD